MLSENCMLSSFPQWETLPAQVQQQIVNVDTI